MIRLFLIFSLTLIRQSSGFTYVNPSHFRTVDDIFWNNSGTIDRFIARLFRIPKKRSPVKRSGNKFVLGDWFDNPKNLNDWMSQFALQKQQLNKL
jgi:hypothetical protein